MTPIENARCGAGVLKAGRRFTLKYSRDRRALQDSAEIGSARWERQIERVHSLGPRAVAELLAEIAAATGQHVRVVDLVEEYARLDPELIRAVGADNFPPMPLGVVR